VAVWAIHLSSSPKRWIAAWRGSSDMEGPEIMDLLIHGLVGWLGFNTTASMQMRLGGR